MMTVYHSLENINEEVEIIYIYMYEPMEILELKSIKFEMERSLEGLKGICELPKKKSSNEFEDRLIEIMQSEEQRI